MIDTARLLYIAVSMLHFTECEAWHKTPYQIIKLFDYHREYNPHIFRREKRQSEATADMDDIDIALGGF